MSRTPYDHSDHTEFVDALRVCLGLEPIYRLQRATPPEEHADPDDMLRRKGREFRWTDE